MYTLDTNASIYYVKSVIAATALFTGTRLVTKNAQDFEKVADLVVEGM